MDHKDSDDLRAMNEVFDVMFEKALKYTTEFRKWFDAHPNTGMNGEQLNFMSLSLSKMNNATAIALLSNADIFVVMDIAFRLGYRSGWEASKTDTLLKENKVLG